MSRRCPNRRGRSGLVKPRSVSGPDLVFNGNFENGFNETGYGEVGRGWGPFTNGGAANYGFYDEQWEAVISNADMVDVGACAADQEDVAGMAKRRSGRETVS